MADKTPKFTKRDFQWLADHIGAALLNACPDDTIAAGVISKLATDLAATNDNFDGARFIKAARAASKLP